MFQNGSFFFGQVLIYVVKQINKHNVYYIVYEHEHGVCEFSSEYETLWFSLCVGVQRPGGEGGQSSSELPNYTVASIAKWVAGGRASGSGAKTNVKSLTADFSPRPTKIGAQHTQHAPPPRL
jgi:hypothetical protein